VAGLFYLFSQFLINYFNKSSLQALFGGIASDATGPTIPSNSKKIR
jgi:hypothetical protein